MKISTKLSLATVLLLVFALAVPAQNPPQKKVDHSKIIGLWALEVDAGGEYYYLILELKLEAEKLGGGLSEQNGMFKDVPLSNIEFDGQTLKCEAKTPTPPDGAERLIKIEVKLVDNKLEGLITVPDLSVSAGVSGTKK
jgi:hypothetical protein